MTPVQLEVGDDKISLERIPRRVSGVAMIDLRGRHVPMRLLGRDEFEEMRAGRQQFRGLPCYYVVDRKAGHIDIWPCAAHQWRVVVLTEEVADGVVG